MATILAKRHALSTRPQLREVTSHRARPTLPGFDNAQYLAVNRDVASAGITNGLEHYWEYGRKELRRLLMPGQGIDHSTSRMLSSDKRDQWKVEVDALCAQTPIDEIIAAHPRAQWLQTGFTLAGYLQEREDIAIAVAMDDPRKAAFHFLEFGLEEGYTGRPEHWSKAYIEKHYRITLDDIADAPVSVESILAPLLETIRAPLDISLNEPQFWELCGLSGKIMPGLFDHEYYHAAAKNAGIEPPAHGRIDCIRHFVSTGMTQLLPVQPGLAFDAAFYTSELLSNGLLQPAPRDETQTNAEAKRDLYKHWLCAGMRNDIFPNLQAWAKHHYGLDIPQALLSQLSIFQRAAGMPQSSLQRDVVKHLILSPRPGAAPLDSSSTAVLDCLVSIADRLAITGSDEQAEWLYWQLLGRHPHHNRATRHLADLLQRNGRMDIVQSLRARIPVIAADGWNTLNLSEAFLKAHRFTDAANTLSALPHIALSDVAVCARKRTLADQIFFSIWSNLGEHVAAYGIECTQKQLYSALRACTPPFTSAQRSQVVRHVAIVGNVDLPQCKLYRIDQKAEQLRRAGYDVTTFAYGSELDRFRSQLDAFDAVVFYRVPAFPHVIEAIAAAAQHGLLTFYDIDDIIFDAAHFPPNFESYAGQITALDYATMACGVPLFEHAMSLCDYGIASTATIATLMKAKVRTGQVFEHHNALGRLHNAAIRATPLKTTQHSADSPVVIFYASGTRAHKEDFHKILEPALAEIAEKYPDRVEIVLIGHFSDFTQLNPALHPVTVLEPIWEFEEFCSRLAQADINLSVLSSSLLTDAKSEIKWMEAAMFGIPSVVSSTATHREVIDDGNTGLLCSNTADFVRALDRMVSDSTFRISIGAAAREAVMDRYSVKALGDNLRGVFEMLRPPKKKKTRLLVVNVFYPPQAIGGATRVVHDNVTLLHERYGDRYEIDVVCTLEGGQTPLQLDTYVNEGVRVWAITAPGTASGDMAPLEPRNAPIFEKIIEQVRPDLVHFHCVQRLTASVVDVVRHRAIPYVITLHDSWWISPHQFIIDNEGNPVTYNYDARHAPSFPDRARALARPLMGASRLLAVSESFAQLHRQACLENVVTVENGVPPLPIRPRKASKSGRVRLAHIGGASRHKGIHLVRNALLANDYRNLELLVIDHAMPPDAQVHEIWGTTPITITSKTRQSEISDLYARTDVLLAPSIWPESYGLVTREAMYCGVWVIASDRGAIGDGVCEGLNGHRVDVSNYLALAECLWKVDSDPARYGAVPQNTATLRSAADQVDDLVNIYDVVLKETGESRHGF